MEETVNTNVFPAKLWRLVNSPGIGAIRWDSHGQLVVIDQPLFQSQILSAGVHREDGFKTTNFSSFIRQLNLYGFKKADPTMIHQGVKDCGSCLLFYNPNFQRNRPELLANLRRLTAQNKARIEAGLDIKSRFSSLSVEIGEKSQKRKNSPPLPARLQSTQPPYHPDQSQVQKPPTGTPIPPQYMVGNQRGDPFFAPVQHIPVSLRHQYSGGASSSMQGRQGLQSPANGGNPPFTRFTPQTAQYKPLLYYPSVCQCCHFNVKPNIQSLQTEFSPPKYHQGTVNQEAQKFDINLDAIFQIADEMMQASPSAEMVQVQPPKDPVSVLKPFPGTSETMPCENDTSSTSTDMPVVVVAFSVQTDKDEDSVTSVPQQIPQDAIFEAASDQEKDAEIINVEVSDPAGDTSHK